MAEGVDTEPYDPDFALALRTSLPPTPCMPHQLDIDADTYESLMKNKPREHNGSEVRYPMRARRPPEMENQELPVAAGGFVIYDRPRELLAGCFTELFMRQANGLTEWTAEEDYRTLVQLSNLIGTATETGPIMEADPKEFIDECFADTRYTFEVRPICSNTLEFEACTQQQFDIHSGRCVDYTVPFDVFMELHGENMFLEAEKQLMKRWGTVAFLFRKRIPLAALAK